jgi:hypothetical protein
MISTRSPRRGGEETRVANTIRPRLAWPKNGRSGLTTMKRMVRYRKRISKCRKLKRSETQ